MRALPCGLLLMLIVAGCGHSGPPIIPITTAPVSGTATFEGKPLEDYRVYFFSSEAKAQEPATGRIGADGKFVLGVRKPDDGAMVGKNQVWFSYDPPKPDQVPGQEVVIPLPPPKVKLPEKYLSQEKSGLTVDVPSGGLKDYKLDLK